MSLLRRLMLAFRRSQLRAADPALHDTRERIDAAERRLARKLNLSIEDLRANYERGDHVLGHR